MTSIPKMNTVHSVKKCSMCNAVKPLSDFYKRSDSKDGRRNQCKECWNAKGAAWYESNRERVLSRASERYKADPDRYKEYQSTYRSNNATKIKQRKSRHYIENKETILKSHSGYYFHNKDKYRKYSQKRRAKKAQVDNDDHTDAQVWDLYGTDCYLCGVQVVEDGERISGLYHEEHVIPIDLGGDNTLDNVRPSCQPCNSSKYVSPLLKFLAQRPFDDLVVTEADSSEYAEECRRLDSGMICRVYRLVAEEL